jgi:hypothetical protein
MYTSCGWFFDEISGLEPVQVLKYAAMAIQYVRGLGGGALEEEFVRRLGSAPSNVPVFGDGAQVYRRLVRPAVVDLRRVVAHYAISSLFETYGEEERIYAFTVRRLDEQGDAQGGTALRVGHVRVRSEITGEAEEVTYALLHHGGHDFHCSVRRFVDLGSYDEMKAELLRRYAHGSLSDIVRALDHHFPGAPYSLRDLFLEERRKILARVTEAALERYEATYRRIWEENRRFVRYLSEADAVIPDALAMLARHVLARDIVAEVAQIEAAGVVPERVFDLASEAQEIELTLDLSAARPAMRRAVAAAMRALTDDPSSERVHAALALIECAQRLDVGFGIWDAQNQLFEIWRARPEARRHLRPLADRLGFQLRD